MGLVALAALLFWAAQTLAANPQPPRLVVVLYPEANDGSPGTILADQGIRATFAAGSQEPIEIYNEFLDVSRLPGADYQQELAGVLRRKYSGRSVDLVIAGLGSGLNFALQHRDEIFPEVPIVFLAVDRKEIESRQLPADVIGQPIKMDLSASLELALDLHPQTEHIFVVAGQSKFDSFWESKAKAAFDHHAGQMEIVYLTGLPLAELQTAVERLPGRSLIYYLHVFEDREGRVYIPAEVLFQISTRANAPIYSHVDSYLGRGIVGGRVFSFQAAGREAAQLGLRILSGEKAASIGIQPSSESSNIFDWRQLQRWDISEARLPAGSEVRYRELSPWERNRWRVAGVVAVCALQTVLIAALLAQRLRRTRAESELHKSQEELRQLTAQILGTQEAERRRIARELHDDFGQSLALLSVELDIHRQRPPASREDSDARLEAMSTRVKSLSSSIHDLSHQLHPLKLEQLGLIAAIRGLCKELNQNQGLKIEFTHDGMPAMVPPAVALCLYRIAQEALRNVVKHSGVACATVTLRGDQSTLCLEVCDAGSGFDCAQVAGQGGLGLVSMRERLRLVDGELLIDSQIAAGTRLNARVPLCASAAADVESSPNVAHR